MDGLGDAGWIGKDDHGEIRLTLLRRMRAQRANSPFVVSVDVQSCSRSDPEGGSQA